MERNKSWLAALTFALVCTCACVFGQTEEVNDKRIIIGSRDMSIEQAQDIEHVREMLLGTTEEEKHVTPHDKEAIEALAEEATLLAEAEENIVTEEDVDIEAALFANVNEEEAALQPLFSNFIGPQASLFSYDSYPYCVHHAAFVSPGGYTIELEDGSIWRVEPSDAYCVNDWSPFDDILIQPGSWLSFSPNFYFYNVQTRSAITVTLKMGPFYDSPFTRWIIAINYATGEVWLDDGSHFWINVDDDTLFQDWRINDTIIIGNNSGMASYKWPNVLINVNTYNPLRKDPNGWKGNSLYVQARWIY